MTRKHFGLMKLFGIALVVCCGVASSVLAQSASLRAIIAQEETLATIRHNPQYRAEIARVPFPDDLIMNLVKCTPNTPPADDQFEPRCDSVRTQLNSLLVRIPLADRTAYQVVALDRFNATHPGWLDAQRQQMIASGGYRSMPGEEPPSLQLGRVAPQ